MTIKVKIRVNRNLIILLVDTNRYASKLVKLIKKQNKK